MKIRVITLLAALALASLAAWGCGDNGTGDQTNTLAEIPDPCTLITREDAAAIAGEPVNAGLSEAEEGKASCTYRTTAEPERIVSIQVIKPCSMADLLNYVTPDSNLSHGVGMHSYWDKTSLTVHTTANVCLIAAGGGPPRSDPTNDKAAEESAKKVAQLIIDRMGIQEPE